jgi:hypothetical protein
MDENFAAFSFDVSGDQIKIAEEGTRLMKVLSEALNAVGHSVEDQDPIVGQAILWAAVALALSGLSIGKRLQELRVARN